MQDMCALCDEDALYNTLPALIMQARWFEAHEINKQVILNTLNAQMDCYRTYCTADSGISAQCMGIINAISKMKELYQHTVIKFWEQVEKPAKEEDAKRLYDFTRSVDEEVDKLKRLENSNGVPTHLDARKAAIIAMTTDLTQKAETLINQE